MKNKFYPVLFFVLFAFIFAACEDRSEISAPEVSTGTADFTTFVSLGNSLTAGFQNNALYESSQRYTLGKLIADQVGTSYEQPYISDPGIGSPGRIEMVSLSPAKISYNSNLGETINIGYSKPYNNLAVPGAVLFDMMDTTDFAQKFQTRRNPFFQIVLRNAAMGKSILQQAISLNPSFMTLWIGNNDVLGYATSGGVSPSAPTDANLFNLLYTNLVDGIVANTNAKVAVANIPDVKAIPFFTTVGPQMAVGIKGAIAQNSQIQGLIYEKSSGIGITKLDLADDALITLPAMNYASLLGQPTGKWYRDNNYPGLPSGVDTTKPFGFHPQNPWPNALILDLDEQANVSQATQSFNQTISNLVNQHSDRFVLVDMHAMLNQFRNAGVAGITFSGIRFSTSFVTGELFSLDGVHLTTRGYGVAANEFIRAINSKFNAQIPLVNVAALPGSLPLSN